MKKALFSLTMMLAVVFVGFNANAQTPVQPETGAVIEFDKETHNYGTIKQNAEPNCYFEITNTGNEPLIISNAKGSCGCTVPSYDKSPIMPGDSRKLTVRYDTKRVGPINKSVTITSNAVNSPTKVIRITGKVEALPAAGAPTNTTGPANK